VHTRYGSTYAALALATAPFALVNAPPARMFMGDAGAVPLGFLAAACGIAGWLDGVWPLWLPLLAFLPFIADATVTLARRLVRGERVWEAHREHYYQRLNRLGAGHRGTLAVYGALMLGTSASAVLALKVNPEAGWIVLGVWCALLGIGFAGIDYHWGLRQSR
jgi:UDP-N-acetylmuramyl pentapeptide phosphotransferase/UDP-N-acetylglucosamine-1-phosphate transferase